MEYQQNIENFLMLYFSIYNLFYGAIINVHVYDIDFHILSLEHIIP